MIHLNIGIGDGDVDVITFTDTKELLEYFQELKMFDCVWLFKCDEDIFITENIESITFNVNKVDYDVNLHLQEYESYEDAYAVALDMREENPKCYSKSL